MAIPHESVDDKADLINPVRKVLGLERVLLQNLFAKRSSPYKPRIRKKTPVQRAGRRLLRLEKRASSFGTELINYSYKQSSLDVIQDFRLNVDDFHQRIRLVCSALPETLDLTQILQSGGLVNEALKLLKAEQKYLYLKRWLKTSNKDFPQQLPQIMKKILITASESSTEHVQKADADTRDGCRLPLPDTRYVPCGPLPKVIDALEIEDTEFVTLWGVSGVGKTSLAKHLANKLKESRWSVRYLPCGEKEPIRLQKDLLAILGHNHAGDSHGDADGLDPNSYPDLDCYLPLKEYSRLLRFDKNKKAIQNRLESLRLTSPQGRLLVVLDDVCEDVLVQLVVRCRDVKYLVTSREENVWTSAVKIEMVAPGECNAREIVYKHTAGLLNQLFTKSSLQGTKFNKEWFEAVDELIKRVSYHPLSLVDIAGILMNEVRNLLFGTFHSSPPPGDTEWSDSSLADRLSISKSTWNSATIMKLMLDSLLPDAKSLFLLTLLLGGSSTHGVLIKFFFEAIHPNSPDDEDYMYHIMSLEERFLIRVVPSKHAHPNALLNYNGPCFQLRDHETRMCYIKYMEEKTLKSLAARILQEVGSGSKDSAPLENGKDELIFVLSAMYYIDHPDIEYLITSKYQNLSRWKRREEGKEKVPMAHAFDIIRARKYRVPTQDLMYLLSPDGESGSPSSWQTKAAEHAQSLLVKLIIEEEFDDNAMANLVEEARTTELACHVLESIYPCLLEDNLPPKRRSWSFGQTREALLKVVSKYNENLSKERQISDTGTAAIRALKCVLKFEGEDTRSIGITTSDPQAVPVLYKVSLSKFGETSGQVLELMFFDTQGMKSLLGIGLLYSEVSIGPNFSVTVKEISKETWESRWRDPTLLTNYKRVMFKQVSSAEVGGHNSAESLHIKSSWMVCIRKLLDQQRPSSYAGGETSQRRPSWEDLTSASSSKLSPSGTTTEIEPAAGKANESDPFGHPRKQPTSEYVLETSVDNKPLQPDDGKLEVEILFQSESPHLKFQFINDEKDSGNDAVLPEEPNNESKTKLPAWERLKKALPLPFMKPKAKESEIHESEENEREPSTSRRLSSSRQVSPSMQTIASDAFHGQQASESHGQQPSDSHVQEASESHVQQGRELHAQQANESHIQQASESHLASESYESSLSQQLGKKSKANASNERWEHVRGQSSEQSRQAMPSNEEFQSSILIRPRVSLTFHNRIDKLRTLEVEVSVDYELGVQSGHSRLCSNSTSRFCHDDLYFSFGPQNSKPSKSLLDIKSRNFVSEVADITLGHTTSTYPAVPEGGERTTAEGLEQQPVTHTAKVPVLKGTRLMVRPRSYGNTLAFMAVSSVLPKRDIDATTIWEPRVENSGMFQSINMKANGTWNLVGDSQQSYIFKATKTLYVYRLTQPPIQGPVRKAEGRETLMHDSKLRLTHDEESLDSNESSFQCDMQEQEYNRCLIVNHGFSCSDIVVQNGKRRHLQWVLQDFVITLPATEIYSVERNGSNRGQDSSYQY